MKRKIVKRFEILSSLNFNSEGLKTFLELYLKLDVSHVVVRQVPSWNSTSAYDHMTILVEVFVFSHEPMMSLEEELIKCIKLYFKKQEPNQAPLSEYNNKEVKSIKKLIEFSNPLLLLL